MKQAMILAAGLGTRLKPLTDTMPKALVHVNGAPLIDLCIRRLQSQGYERFVVNVHHFAQQIIDHIAKTYPQDSRQTPYSMPCPQEIHISDETEQLLETGGALKKAQRFFDSSEPILIHNVDILDNVDYNWFARQHLADEDAVLLVSRRATKRYLLFNNAMQLMGWINTETGEVRSPFSWLRDSDITIDNELRVAAQPNSQLSARPPVACYQRDARNLNAFAFSGIHSFSPRLFPLMDRFPDRFSIIDFYLSICHRSRIVGTVKDDLQVLDVGKLDSLDKAKDFIQFI